MGTPKSRLVEISRFLRPFLGALTFKELRHYIGDPFSENVEGCEQLLEVPPSSVTAPLSLGLNDRVRKLTVGRGVERTAGIITKARHEDLILKLVKDGGADLRFYYMTLTFGRSDNMADQRLYCTRGVITSISDQGKYPSDRLSEYLAEYFWHHIQKWRSESETPREESIRSLQRLGQLIKLPD